jgi:hypothetical protein
MLLATCRDDITVEKVLSFPIGPIPSSLFHEDGIMRKTNKADLCHALESDVTSISQLTPFDRSSTVLIQDDMALLQSMNVEAFKTFGQVPTHGEILIRDSYEHVKLLPIYISVYFFGQSFESFQFRSCN